MKPALSSKPKNAVLNVRVSEEELTEMQACAEEMGIKSLSQYVRTLHRANYRESQAATQAKNPSINSAQRPKQFLKTSHGKIYHGDSLGLLFKTLAPNSVDLIMTSPPFGLVRKKSYGNEDAHKYVDWFRPFAEGMHRVLKDNGSIAIDIGGAWKPGIPTRSLYHFELLIAMCEEYGFHLCLEHYWWNPAKLPTPAEWVNIRRVRVKDAVNTVWWLSKTPYPKASNKRVLAPYSSSMKSLLKNGYKANLRPSGHNISEKFSKNNGGSVPPNLLAIANTESNGRYQKYCKEKGINPHPARFPPELPEYFIKMCTDPGDLVVDPFGGSCVTGEVAERLERTWICCDLDREFLEGARIRFSQSEQNRLTRRTDPYTVYPPCLIDGDNESLSEDGGATRPKR